MNQVIKVTENSERKIDELGRIVIPYQLREKMHIKENDTLKICEKDNMIILIKKENDTNIRRKFNLNNNRRKKS